MPLHKTFKFGIWSKYIIIRISRHIINDNHHHLTLRLSREPTPIRDWSLITGRWGGYKMGKLRVQNLLRPPPPPPRQGKTFCTPGFKESKLFASPFNMARTWLPRKNYCKTFCASPSAWLKLFPASLFIGVKLHVPPPPVL